MIAAAGGEECHLFHVVDFYHLLFFFLLLPTPSSSYAALVFAINCSEEDAAVAAAAASIDPPDTFNPALAAMVLQHTHNLQLIIHLNSIINLT